MSSIPYDILLCILIRLPVKSLLRFQSVSKSWNTVISDDKFKKAHCDQSRALGRLKFLLHRRRIPYNNDVKEIGFVELKSPNVLIDKQLLPLRNSHVICSHDGLIVLLHRRKVCIDAFVLWNPSTRQHKKFVCPYNVVNSSRILLNACGLCYDSITDDYKIILVFQSFYVVCCASNNFWMMKNTLPILEQNLKDIDWLSSVISDDGITEGASTSEGYVYWSLDSHVTQHRSKMKCLSQHVGKMSTIICFNAKSDELEGFPIPDFIGEIGLFHLSTLNGCLSLYGGEKDEMNVWIMEQDKWKWLVKIRRVTPCVRSTKLLYCTKDGEFIFHGPGKHTISISNPRKQTLGMTTYKPFDYLSACEYRLREPPCLDSLCFPRLDTHAQDQA